MSIFLVIILILLFALIILSTLKLSIYFNAFLYLSKPANYDKANYISNSSFFKYFYDTRLSGDLPAERVITAVLVILASIAMIGGLFYRQMNYGYLSYYYGDPLEYIFVNLFIYIVFLMALFYALAFAWWYNNDMAEDTMLENNEKRLNEFFVGNLDYDLLYEYYVVKQIEPANASKIGNKIKGYDTDNPFKILFTYHILKDSRFALIRDHIIELIDKKIVEAGTGKDEASLRDDAKKHTYNIASIPDAIKKDKAFYIIANYNHNNSVALPQLEVMIDGIRRDNSIDSKTLLNGAGTVTVKDSLNALYDNYSNQNGAKEDINKMMKSYETAQEIFMDTIKDYKMIYDKYYSYYMWSVLLSNFTVIYAILIFVYIIIKILASKNELFDDTQYNLYYFRTDLKSYGIYIISLYYLLTTPIIIFGFN